MIKKITKRFRPSDDRGFLHNSREDVASLAKFCNELADKVNELTDKVNELDKSRKEGV
ncbi:hypothetical protein [Paenibacillus apiarius]|uniref:Uncharacterized protein n=1 Tax=Paenibacillus apiarius TaxID=46240 RepID=A0ABT4DVH6_9BACL|nr:hypothetical protein [Paenibacillus apiarius]MCY9513292.1 hypothetical protein [Paenibacillus apiarius]MCY9521349.1 hypothetical protein [Paenibacillus apiarius]MCY9555576.1 hypothetical protein [Paenibacillus apiarius]MCY9560708.1 hypothetical protein [Paenibacillus apiarius]MCY9685041.1 hypothetical protein [Paenibacillus apiarius]